MTTGPLSIISPFSLRLRSFVVILHTGNWPGPALAVSAHFSRFSPAQLCLVQADRKCANFLFLVMASDWRTMDARYPHPERNHTHKWKKLLSGPLPQCAILSTEYHRAGKSPAMRAHTTHHTTQAARPRPARTIDEMTGDDHRRANGHATFSQIAPG